MWVTVTVCVSLCVRACVCVCVCVPVHVRACATIGPTSSGCRWGWCPGRTPWSGPRWRWAGGRSSGSGWWPSAPPGSPSGTPSPRSPGTTRYRLGEGRRRSRGLPSTAWAFSRRYYLNWLSGWFEFLGTYWGKASCSGMNEGRLKNPQVWTQNLSLVKQTMLLTRLHSHFSKRFNDWRSITQLFMLHSAK